MSNTQTGNNQTSPKEQILSRINFQSFYSQLIPSLKENGRGAATGLCPFHEDRNPSFSLNLESGLFHCFGCGVGGDIFTFYQKLKGVSFQDALKDMGHMVGLNGNQVKPKVVEVFKYHDEAGKVVYWKERIEPGRNGKKKEFLFYHTKDEKKVPSRGGAPLPYNLPGLVKANGPIYFVEGEAKADQLNQWGFTATCLDAGTGSLWRPDYLPYFQGKDVVLLPDNDGSGRAYAERIAGVLVGHIKSIKVVMLPGLPEKGDIIDWVKEPGNTKEEFLKVVESSPEWEPEVEVNAPPKEPGEWIDPIPLDEYSLLPEFPTDLLPSIGYEIVQSVAEVNQVDPGLPGSLYLATLATSLAKKIEVNLITHQEPINIYVCAVLDSGERKTRTESIITKPIYEYQEKKQIEMTDEIREALNTYKINEVKLSRLQKEAAHSGDQLERLRLEREAAEIAKQMQNNPIPKPPVLIVDDVTTESLGIPSWPTIMSGWGSLVQREGYLASWPEDIMIKGAILISI